MFDQNVKRNLVTLQKNLSDTCNKQQGQGPSICPQQEQTTWQAHSIKKCYNMTQVELDQVRFFFLFFSPCCLSLEFSDKRFPGIGHQPACSLGKVRSSQFYQRSAAINWYISYRLLNLIGTDFNQKLIGLSPQAHWDCQQSQGSS